MEKILRESKKRNRFFHLTIFTISAIIIALLFPNGGKFPYEYVAGQPWKHENLLASFDFPIKKLKETYEKQKDSILKSYVPYYGLDTSISNAELSNLKQNFRSKWENSIKEKTSKNTSQFFKKLKNPEQDLKLQEKVLNQLITIIDSIYSRGVFDVTVFSDLQKKGLTKAKIIQNNEAHECDLIELFTLRQAYEFLFKEMEQINANSPYWIDEKNLIESLNLNEYLRVNLKYNELRSNQEKTRIVDELPSTEGMIQSGQNIIFQGEIVTSYKIRVLDSFKYEFESKMTSKSNFLFIALGNLIIVFVPLFILYLFITNYRKNVLTSNLRISFLLILSFLFILIGWLAVKISPSSLYIIPFTIVPIIISTFYDSRLALFVHLVTIQIVGFIAPNGFEFVFLQFVAGAVAIFSLTNMQKRGHIFAAAAFITFSYCFVFLGLSIIQMGDIRKIDLARFSNFGLNGMLILTSYLWIYLCEKLFGFVSDVSLIELMDSNNSLLRLLAEKAPGTFQHSIQVANLAEEAIIQTGGNPHLVRAGAMYHDIGKINAPHYYIENQIHSINPHEKLEFDKSAEIIINHVGEGVKLAHKYHLPEQLIDFIRTHHGTTKAWYFYRSFKNKFPGVKVDIEKFSYPGPIPFSKETAVLMIADSIEAASRSLKTIDENTIHELVESIINFQIAENQFDNSNITFKDITIIKKVFKTKLKNIYHARIEYPD